MKLSLSVRIAESFVRKDQTTMTFDEIVQLAQGIGYDAVCMRASQVGIDTDPAIVQQRRAQLDTAGLKVSMVTGDFEVPRNNDRGPDCLRKITPYLDLAERFGAKMIRVCMKKDADIPWRMARPTRPRSAKSGSSTKPTAPVCSKRWPTVSVCCRRSTGPTSGSSTNRPTG